jgi:hypothetical protein
MTSIKLCCLVFALNAGQPARSDEDAWKDDWRDRIVEWRQALDRVEIDDTHVAHLVNLLDPRPREKVRPFKDERLEGDFITDSRNWFSAVFHPRSNPFEHGLKGPTGYDLAPDEKRRSNLRYEWETPIYRFEIIESVCVIALRTRLRTGAWWEKTRVPAGRVEDTVRALIREGKDDRGRPVPLPPFRLPVVAEPGKPFTNHPGGFTFDPDRGWREGIVGCVTRDGVTLLIPKSTQTKPYSAAESQFTIYPQIPYFMYQDEKWLPAHPYVKDTNQLVIEKMWGKPFPRPKPAASK